jgi:hypothetical protein
MPKRIRTAVAGGQVGVFALEAEDRTENPHREARWRFGLIVR